MGTLVGLASCGSETQLGSFSAAEFTVWKREADTRAGTFSLIAATEQLKCLAQGQFTDMFKVASK